MTKKLSTVQKVGSVEISDGSEMFTFREPLGKDLNTLDKLLKSYGEASDTESLAAMMQTLSQDELTAEDYLELPLKTFKYIGKELMEFFRTEDD